MHPSLSMLDKAIELARRESGLLKLDDVAGLEESVESRIELVEKAWNERGDCDAAQLRAKLETLHLLQQELDALARQEHEQARGELKVRKKTSQAIDVYGNKTRRSLLPQMIMRQS